MPLDRTGEPRTEPHCCRNGWLTGPNDDHPKPCPIHKARYYERPRDDEPNLSSRARAAIEKANRDDT